MRLSWNEIRARAAAFANDWEGEGYEKGQTQLFYRDFFDIFGIPVRRVASFEEPVKNLGEKRGFIDLFWKGVLLVEQKSKGRDLKKAKTQALEYFPGLKDAELPRFILLSDFQNFELYDLEEDDATSFKLADLPKKIEKFAFVLGKQKRSFRDQDPVNIKASELVGKLHDALEASGYVGHKLEQFLVRIVFCLFADDTGIFEPRDIFLDLLENRSREDGSDLGGWLAQLFQTLNTPEDERPNTLDADIARLPYVNGDLFKDALLIPSFDSNMRKRLIEACQFDWSAISPAIFGSLFQSVMNAEERRNQGAHYTSEKNILKVIEPLFMDELRAEFARLKARKDNRRASELEAFQKRLSKQTFFDPACGCGNFLIIAYRELRELEIEIIRELRISRSQLAQGELDTAVLSLIDVDQFYGIEIDEFPAKIAETALWMMDHIMNNRLSLEFGQSFVRIPLKKSPHILVENALEESDRAELLAQEPKAKRWLRPYVGGDELISGQWRWCLWLKDADPSELRKSKAISERLERVRKGRLKSPTPSVRDYAKFPTLFTQDRQPDVDYLAIPEVSSETREYIPIDQLSPDVIASNKLQIIPGAPLFYFGILTSAMHMAWMRTVGGRLKSDYSYSPSIYNSFPWPVMNASQQAEIERLAQAVIDARAAFPDSTLDDLYDADGMPPALRRAHIALDRAVDKLYRRAAFKFERERVEHLFELYEKATAPLAPTTATPRKVRR